MRSFYVASPWFTEFTALIKGDMLDVLKQRYKDIIIFDPHETEASKSYDVSPSPEVSKQIFKENVDHVTSSTDIIFPKFTNDLGTLIEIGIALRKGNIKLHVFDYLTQDIKEINSSKLDVVKSKLKYIDKPTIFKIDSPNSAILIGYNYDNPYLSRSYYYNSFNEDNVMLYELGLTSLTGNKRVM